MNALFINGFYRACSYTNYNGEIVNKMILWRVGIIAEKIGWLGKPLCKCIACMASIHSILPFWLFSMQYNIENSILWYIIYIPALSGLSVYIEHKIQ
jgi:hypothetical protein